MGKHIRGKKISGIAAFTLLEMSVVVAILGLLGAAYVRYYTSQIDANNTAALNATLDTVETALLNFRSSNGRLPCPATITSAENAAAFGTEVGVPGDGYCGTYGGAGGTAPDYENSSTHDPDKANGSDNNYAGSADPLYDVYTDQQIVAGALPTKALKLPDKYAYDPWGRKILYAVDKRITAGNAFTTYPAYTPPTIGSVGGIVIKSVGTNNNASACSANAANPAGTSCLSAATTIKAIYALVSFGKNGHGGYVRNQANSSVVFNASSNNADELTNCHCTDTATASYFTRIFVQKPLVSVNTLTSGFTTSFDDVVRFKTRQDMDVFWRFSEGWVRGPPDSLEGCWQSAFQRRYNDAGRFFKTVRQ